MVLVWPKIEFGIDIVDFNIVKTIKAYIYLQ